MTHRIHITADRHEQPDLDQFVAALLAWALAEAATEEDGGDADGSSTGKERQEAGDD